MEEETPGLRTVEYATLDINVSAKCLERRYAISSSTPEEFHLKEARQMASRYLLKRRGAVSYESSAQAGRYIHMLASACSMKNYQNKTSDWMLVDKLSSDEYKLQQRTRVGSLNYPKKRSNYTNTTSNSLMDNVMVSESCYANIDSWNFNVFNMDKVTNGRSLLYTSLKLFYQHGFVDTFHLDHLKLIQCISLIEDNYHAVNPYHNAIHAADVTQAMHCFLLEDKISQCFSPLEKMVTLLSAIVHDVDHPGVNNAFLVATSNHLATLYNNVSILENHHLRIAMGIINETRLFDHLDRSTYDAIQKTLKSLILATDITRQQEFLTKLKESLDANVLDVESNKDDRLFVSQICLKCADISNPCRPFEISSQWSNFVCDEFFKQGDYERSLGLDVTPLCDRLSTTVPKLQIGFFEFVVGPLFKEWYRFMPSQTSIAMLANLHANKLQWMNKLNNGKAHECGQESEEVYSDTMSDCDTEHSEVESLIAEGNLHLVDIPAEIGDLLGIRRHSIPTSTIWPPRKRRLSTSYGRRHSLPRQLLYSSRVKSTSRYNSNDFPTSPASSPNTLSDRFPTAPASSPNTLSDRSTSEASNAVTRHPVMNTIRNLSEHYDISSITFKSRTVALNKKKFPYNLPRRNSSGTIGSYSTVKILETECAIPTVVEESKSELIEIMLPLTGTLGLFTPEKKETPHISRLRSMSLESGADIFSKLVPFNIVGDDNASLESELTLTHKAKSQPFIHSVS